MKIKLNYSQKFLREKQKRKYNITKSFKNNKKMKIVQDTNEGRKNIYNALKN